MPDTQPTDTEEAAPEGGETQERMLRGALHPDVWLAQLRMETSTDAHRARRRVDSLDL